MFNLTKTSLLSFEISDKCNLMCAHDQCPVNKRCYSIKEKHLDKQSIIDIITSAKKLGFNGMVAFHYYNEPLLNKSLVEKIVDALPNTKFLLWTNGLLLDRTVENNKLLSKITKVCITCYDRKDMPFFEALSDYYKNIEIFDWELDDRLEIYNKTTRNDLSCKRPFFEIPIDYYGNIHLCCMDWNNQFKIGNVFENEFEQIILSDKYQSLLESLSKRLLGQNAPDICKTCDKMWVSYPKYYSD